MKLFNFENLFRVTFSALLIFWTQQISLAAPVKCAKVLVRAGQPKFHKYVMTGREKSLKDLEAVFKNLQNGEAFELRIPKGTQLNLFSREPAYHTRYSEGKVGYYPYNLSRASSEDAKYLDDRLSSLQEALLKITKSQETNEALTKVWQPNAIGKFFFSLSPTSAKSNQLFKNPVRLNEITNRVDRLGNFPFMYIEKSGDMVITNANFLNHIKERGTKTLTLYRGHNSFDYFYYRLLLGKSEAKVRIVFAEWLEKNSTNTMHSRGVDKNTIMTIIQILKNKNSPTENALSLLSSQAASAAMFTSLSSDHSTYWAVNKERSEVLTLKLDLEKIPEWYLKQILYGTDLDTEVVFPMATKEQRDVLRKSLKIEKAVASK